MSKQEGNQRPSSMVSETSTAGTTSTMEAKPGPKVSSWPLPLFCILPGPFVARNLFDLHHSFVRETCNKYSPQMTDQEIEANCGYVTRPRKQVIADRTRTDIYGLGRILHFPVMSLEGHTSVHMCVKDRMVRFTTEGPRGFCAHDMEALTEEQGREPAL